MGEATIKSTVIAGDEYAISTAQIAGDEYGWETETMTANNCNNCDPALPDTLYVTVANGAGGFAAFNGKTQVDWTSGCIWVSNGGAYPFLQLDSSGAGVWSVHCYIDAGCYLNMVSVTRPLYCDPYSADPLYQRAAPAFGNCISTTCADQDCVDSDGATAVITAA